MPPRKPKIKKVGGGANNDKQPAAAAVETTQEVTGKSPETRIRPFLMLMLYISRW
jgi:hypothetical protein